LDADAEELKDTRNAQLCTFVTSLMVLDAVERLGIEPSYCAGHSLGEYTALTASGALSFDDGVRLVCERAEAVHEAGTVAKELGAKRVMPLPVSGAFHTPYMSPARDRLRKAIAEASPRDTDVPIISNVDALPHDRGQEWASLLSAQLTSPVRWKHCLLELED